MTKGTPLAALMAVGVAYAARSLSAFVLHPVAAYKTSPKLTSIISRNTRTQRIRIDGVVQKAHLTLDVAGSMVAHPAKAARGGEDAFFVLEHDLGVFDGVGAWAAKGHDPGIFTRGFAKAVAANITTQRLEETAALRRAQHEGIRAQRQITQGVDLQQALEHGIDKAPGLGTCTACVVTFDPVYGMLNGANVGDSGALLIRRDAAGTPFVALRSAAQRHRFNQPYQLGTGSRDRAADAQEFLFYVRDGDVVILATDGLLDNMYEADIVQCISEAWVKAPPIPPAVLEEPSPPQAAELAGSLARRAYDLSRDKERVTPWEDEAVAAGVVPPRKTEASAEDCLPAWGWNALERSLSSGLASIRGVGVNTTHVQESRRRDRWAEMSQAQMAVFRGGKMDDITVVVATVGRARRKPKRPVERGSR